ncbi:MAG: histidine phosphatase family protein [Actinomycetia bacterium]|nr:histidine phosphatase family protein [Actinomycetes bacterium]
MLWRHGRTAWNDTGRFQGHLDVALDDVGRGQAARAARVLAAFPPARVVTSDLGRAQETAAALACRTGLDPAVDPRLRETYGGEWQGRLVAEIAASDTERFLAWRAGADVPAGGGETRSELADRAVAAVTAALADVPDGGVLVAVTHGGTARAAIGRMLALPVGSWTALGGLANCSWSVLEESDVPAGWRLAEHNAGSVPEPVIGDDR